MRKNPFWIPVVLALLFVMPAFAAGTDFETIMSRWSKFQKFAEDDSILELTATLYTPEYIDALSLSEAEKNLWTRDEVEQFKYSVLKVSKMDELIPIELTFKVMGSPLHMTPFDRQVELWIGNKSYKAVEYDPRFNFKVDDTRNGMVYFPRFDEKGKDLLEGVKHIKLRINPAMSYALRGKYGEYFWDVSGQTGSLLDLLEGEGARKFEYDRLLKRFGNLNKKKSDLQQEIEELDSEIETIEARMEELKGK